MSLWDELRYRLRRLRPGRSEAELDEEIRTHLALEEEERMAGGVSPEEARWAAQRAFGSVAFSKEETRATWGLGFLDIVWADLRHAVRLLRRRPAFTATAVLSLALAIGACTAMFSVVNGVLLRGLPYPEAERIVAFREVSDRGRQMPVAEPNFLDAHARLRGFEALAQHGGMDIATVRGAGAPVRAQGQFVSADFWKVMGVAPAVGRAFLPDESRPGGEPVAVVGHALWEHLFAGQSPGNARVTVDGQRYRVVGVMPPGFAYPDHTEVWLARELIPADPSRTAHNWSVVGRVAAGSTFAQAQTDATAVARQLAGENRGGTDAVDFALVRLADYLVGGVRHTLLVLFGAVGLLLVIACANVANLLLAQATARQRELAVRAALGATRGRLALQFVVESLLLSLLGAALGVPLAVAGVGVLVGLHADSLPRAESIGIDGGALAFTVGVALVVSVALGLLTALRAPSHDLHVGERGQTPRNRLRRVLVVAQVALTFVLLAGAGLLGRSFARILENDPGFRPETAVAMSIAVTPPADEAGERRLAQFYADLIDRLATLPGVTVVGATNGLPLDGGGGDGTFLVDEDKAKPGQADYRVASEGYFAAMGIPLLRGRTFARTDSRDAAHVALVSASLAARYWPGEDAVGKTIQFGNMDGDPHAFHIVGVVGDVRARSLEAEVRPTVYAFYAQRPQRDLSMVARADARPGALIPAMRAALADLDPALPAELRTVSEVVSGSLAPRRFSLILLGVFAAVALVLAVAGLYGVTAYSVARRTREIGVRVALGARPGAVVAMVVGQGATMVVVGLAIGAVASLAASRLLAGILYGVSASDPTTLVAVSAAVIAATLIACYFPARRAAKIDPMIALRSD